jgi:hypothetical protein
MFEWAKNIRNCPFKGPPRIIGESLVLYIQLLLLYLVEIQN